ncbi:MAG: gamma-glutamyltransferase [Bacteroidetes bacterium]|nr:gamma-glutamyltransferase [Bacteroidota bacterium]
MQKISSLVKFIILSACIISCGPTHRLNTTTYESKKVVEAKYGAVVSAHALASEVGLQILKDGGNAVDAAIATQLALAVVYPAAGNIGGGGFSVIHLKDGRNITIDYRETAPGAAFRDMYLDKNGNPLMDLSQNGHLAAGVPGTVAGIFECMKYASLPFKKLIDPAIMLADKGFAITANEAASLNHTKEDFIKMNTVVPVFVKSTPWEAGDILIQKDLAKTLSLIKDHGQKGFYEGETAALIAAEMKRGHGIISEEDLRKYEAKNRTPVEFEYQGYQIVTMPLSSSGGVILQQMLKMSAMKNISSMQFETPESVQLMTEIERRAYADRAKYLGDPDFYKIPIKTLVSEAYLQGRLKDYKPGVAGSSEVTKEGVIHESDETTHFSVADKYGNAVSITTTLNGGYGSRTVVAGAGFLLNNEMDDFSVKPGVPNMYGAVGQEANAVQPGKRMLSSMTPTIVLKDNKPFIVLGTPGGTTITTSVYQTIVDMLDFKMSAIDAVNKPKFHHQWLPDQLDLEKGFDPEVAKSLIKMGYKIKYRSSIGRTEVIQINPDGTMTAVADHRGDDSAAGY